MAQTSSNSKSTESMKKVIVLGAGVIGLTTALTIQEKGGYQVEIIAEILPTDPKNIKYTSHWAVRHSSRTEMEVLIILVQRRDIQEDVEYPTFLKMWELSAPGGDAEHCFLRIPQNEYFDAQFVGPTPLERMPSYQQIPGSNLPEGVKDGFAFETVTVDVPVYLEYLLSRFLKNGGEVIRGHVQHINQVLEAGSYPFLDDPKHVPATHPDALVVCVGLGARSLGGVEDKTVLPIRGQTVILKAPWIRFGRTFSDEGNKEWSYIIPRRNGNVVLGGTVGADDWYPKPRPETKSDILTRALKLCPELLPPHLQHPDRPAEIKDLLPLIVEEGCGLRPSRKDGARMELEYVTLADSKKIPVIHNYGHGSIGYMSSFGSADIAIRLLEEGIHGL